MSKDDTSKAPDGATLDAATDVMTVASTIRGCIADGHPWTLSLGLLERCVAELRRRHDEGPS